MYVSYKNFKTFIIFRISGFLNLNGTSAVSSELYQVVNYGLAGQYIHHFDAVSMYGALNVQQGKQCTIIKVH